MLDNFQQISPLITTSAFPHEESFFLQKSFCETASKVLTTSCKIPNKKYFLETKYTKLCSLLEMKKTLFEKVDQSLCSNWPESYLAFLQNQTGIARISINDDVVLLEVNNGGCRTAQLVYLLTKLFEELAVAF